MLPILLCAQTSGQKDDFIESYIRDHHIPPSSIYRFHPIKSAIGIDQIREIQTLSRYLTEPALIIVYDFHTSKIETQNAFLKTLEEHHEFVHFILCVRDDSDVLPTIRSRVHVIEQYELNHEQIDVLQTYHLLDIPDLETWMGISQGVSKDDVPRVLVGVIQQIRKKVKKNPIRQTGELLTHMLSIYASVTRNNINGECALDAAGRILAQHNALPLHD